MQDLQRENLLALTNEYFENINFSEISEDWLNDLDDNDYAEAEEIALDSNILFGVDPIDTMNSICIVCEKWAAENKNSSNESTDQDLNVSEAEEDKLWTYLTTIDISVKHIKGFVYYLCYSAKKTSSSIDDKELGLCSARFYFKCLRVDGSVAYSIFNHNLFRLCLDCLLMPGHTATSKDAAYVWNDFEGLLPQFISTLESLIPLLYDFHLGSEIESVDYVFQKLTQLVACETSNNHFNFEADFLSMGTRERKRYSKTYTVTALAFQGLLALIQNNLNGEPEHNCTVMLFGLNAHILCSTVKKSNTIPAKFANIKENAVAFIKHILKNNNNKDLFSRTITTGLKRLCLTVSDKSDFRSTVSKAIFSIMFDLKTNDLIGFLRWLLLLIDSSETSNRTFAIELLGLMLIDTTPTICKEGLPEEELIYTTLIPSIFAMLTRCDDTSSAVRTKALSILSQHMETILKTIYKELNEEESNLCEDFENEDFDIESNGNHRLYWYKLKCYRRVLNEIADLLCRRAEDGNVFTRKAALTAIENLIIFDVSYATKEYLKVCIYWKNNYF